MDQIKSGQWVAYRNHHELLIEGKIAVFTTCEEAQRAADAHLRDGYPNFETINDGFSWRHDPNIEWWTDPYRVTAWLHARAADYELSTAGEIVGSGRSFIPSHEGLGRRKPEV